MPRYMVVRKYFVDAVTRTAARAEVALAVDEYDNESVMELKPKDGGNSIGAIIEEGFGQVTGLYSSRKK